MMQEKRSELQSHGAQKYIMNIKLRMIHRNYIFLQYKFDSPTNKQLAIWILLGDLTIEMSINLIVILFKSTLSAATGLLLTYSKVVC
jgi:hypothetical protein